MVFTAVVKSQFHDEASNNTFTNVSLRDSSVKYRLIFQDLDNGIVVNNKRFQLVLDVWMLR